MAALASDPVDRKHVTTYIRARLACFTHLAVHRDPPRGGVRLDLDTPEDLDFLRRLLAAVGSDASSDAILAAIGAGRVVQ